MTRMKLSAEDRAFLQRLQAIDFGPIAFKLMNPDDGVGLSLAQVTHEIELYRRFLFLSYRYGERQIVPSREIDRVWHTHILDTAKYREDCEQLFGHFVDHWPYFGIRDEQDRQALVAAFDDKKRLFEQYFGEHALAPTVPVST